MLQKIRKAENWQHKGVSLLSEDCAFPNLNTYPGSEDIVIKMTTSSGAMKKENFEHMLFRLDKTIAFLPVNLYQILYINITIYLIYQHI